MWRRLVLLFCCCGVWLSYKLYIYAVEMYPWAMRIAMRKRERERDTPINSCACCVHQYGCLALKHNFTLKYSHYHFRMHGVDYTSIRVVAVCVLVWMKSRFDATSINANNAQFITDFCLLLPYVCALLLPISANICHTRSSMKHVARIERRAENDREKKRERTQNSR